MENSSTASNGYTPITCLDLMIKNRKGPSVCFFVFYLILPFHFHSGSSFLTGLTIVEENSRLNEEVIKLTIDVSKDNKIISNYLYGVNIANWCRSYYLNICAPRLKEAKVSVVRMGGTNMERYNYKNNRMFNVSTRINEYVPVNWESFVKWCRNDLEAEPFLQIPVYGHVAGEGDGINDPDYDYVQSVEEVKEWVQSAGNQVKFWGIGNEPWIAWKRIDYPSIYMDAAHGDQVLNKDTSYDNYFNRFITIASAVKDVNKNALIFGPTSANWELYWSNDWSPYSPVTQPNGPAVPDDKGWQIMLDSSNQWNKEVFPDRGGDPELVGWEEDTDRILCQYAIRMKKYEEEYGIRIADFMDVHRYINPFTDKEALQETRGLWDDTFQSWGDAEVYNKGVVPKILQRFWNIINTHSPGTELSFSEYDFFYWNGHPSIPQMAAIALVDYIGFFAKWVSNLHATGMWVNPINQGEVIIIH